VFARLLTFRQVHDIEAGIAYLREDILPVLHQQYGYRGVSASADRAARTFVVLTVWESEAERDASDSVFVKTTTRAHDLVGGEYFVEQFEQVGVAITKPPGCWLNLVRVRLDPASVDEHLMFFDAELLPQIASVPGFCALRVLVDRSTGRGAVASVWEDRASLEGALAGLPGRVTAATDRGIAIEGVAQREIVVAEIV
jgi:heme-degrading monooxygenase HmoA